MRTRCVVLAASAALLVGAASADAQTTSLGPGLWNTPGTWSTGLVPTAADAVTIAAGHVVTIDTAAVALTVTVANGAVLEFESATARTLTVVGDVTVQNGGLLFSNTAGTVTTHSLSVGGNMVVDGTLDFSTNANTAGAGLVFTGTPNTSLSGSGSVDIRTLQVNKGATTSSIFELMPAVFTVQGSTTDSAASAFLTLTNGTFKVSGSFAGTHRTFIAAGYNILSMQGLWLNNPNYTVAGQNGSPILNGLLRITSGALNIGTAAGDSMGFIGGSTIIIEGGAVNATGRFGVATAANAISYTQSGGTITVCTVGNASTTLASFDLGTGVGTVSMTGGTIVNQLANTGGAGPRDYRNQQGLTGTTTVTGGTLQLGNAASGAAKVFNIAGVVPNLVVTNTSAGHTAIFLAPAVFNNITRSITIQPGATMNVGSNVFLFNGPTLTNDGTLTGNGAATNFVTFLSTAPQTITGSGVFTAPITNFAIQSNLGLVLTPTNQITVGALRLFFGSVTGTNKLTLGNGGATTGVVQIGNTTTPTDAGTFDTAPAFNLGTGGQIASYLRVTAPGRTTGPEINPTRTLTSMTYDDNDPTHNLTIAGGDLTLASTVNALTMTNGRIITGANNLTLSSGSATVTRTNGYVDGNFKKTFAAATNKNFEVGTANGFSPVGVNVTAATAFPVTFTVAAVQTPVPGIQPVSTVLQRYWQLTSGVASPNLTADLTFTYLDPTDIPVTANEAAFVLYRHDGGSNYTDVNGTVNTGPNTATKTGVTQFSPWTLGEPGATPVELLSIGID